MSTPKKHGTFVMPGLQLYEVAVAVSQVLCSLGWRVCNPGPLRV